MKRSLSLEVLVDAADRQAALERDVRLGLTAPAKSVPPVWFYDEVGSRLFDEITRLPEYYPTRAERSVLAERAAEIVAMAGADVLVEIGSGTSDKTRLLLDAMREAGSLRQIVLLDISEEVLREAAATLSRDYDVDVHAVVGDFRSDVGALAKGEGRLWAFLGSTIGNLMPGPRRRFLADVAEAMADDDHLLLGTDLVKDPARLVAAYDDAAGVTAAFNRNLLEVLNRGLGADFDRRRFEHRAVWDPGEAWVEMRLRAVEAHEVRLAGLDLAVAFAEGEEILTETSAKFRPEQVLAELGEAGLLAVASWQDPAGDVQVTLARRAASSDGARVGDAPPSP